MVSDSGVPKDSYLSVVIIYGMANSWVFMYEINLMNSYEESSSRDTMDTA